MYLPSHFDETRTPVLVALARAYPLATLVCHGPEGLLANPIPLLPDDTLSVLRGHVARANPLWQMLGSGLPALAIFHGPQGYVSPSFYPSKAVHGQVVPTWNYAVVHVHGQLRAIDDGQWVRALVEDLTAQHEVQRALPWQLDDAPLAYAERMLAAVVGIELQVERVVGKFKLSQNRDSSDRAGVQQALAETAVGEFMAAVTTPSETP
jgi:transcriptional regulator